MEILVVLGSPHGGSGFATFGVSAFQIYFGSEDVTTAGDDVDVLVAMNPAALITNLKDLVTGGLVIVDTDAFTDKNMARAGYKESPLEDGSLDAYRVVSIDITSAYFSRFHIRMNGQSIIGFVREDVRSFDVADKLNVFD